MYLDFFIVENFKNAKFAAISQLKFEVTKSVSEYCLILEKAQLFV